MAKKYQPQWKDENGVIQDLDLCAKYDGEGNEITHYYVDTVNDQGIAGVKEFNDNLRVNDTIYSMNNSFQIVIPDAVGGGDHSVFYIDVGDDASSCVTLTGYLAVYGDDDDDADNKKPVSNFSHDTDVDAFFYNTGICVWSRLDDPQFYKYSFPKKSGTFGLAIEIVDLTNL